jgi:hypothetical protein
MLSVAARVIASPATRAVARREAGEALVEIGPSDTSATISRLARRKGYIEGASAESFENSSGE